jgi:polar amino acid transport system substrate-binding protein
MEEEPDPANGEITSVTKPRNRPISRAILLGFFPILLILGCTNQPPVDSLERVRRDGVLRYGCDAEGGGPYAFPDPTRPSQVVGFEVDLIRLLTGAFGPTPELEQGQWDALLPLLGTGRIDVVLNGYEWTAPRAKRYLATRPYYVFQLQLMAVKGNTIRSWEDIRAPKPGGGLWRLAVLGGSAAETFARESAPTTADVQYFPGATDAMMAVKNGQADATLQDLPAARFYAGQFPSLDLVGPPVGRGHYVMYLRRGDIALCEALNQGIERLIRSGELRRLYERYDIWTDAQLDLESAPDEIAATPLRDERRGLSLIVQYAPTLLASAAMTIALAVGSMPLAMAIGLLVALGRMYGPPPIRLLGAFYVEILRGTPLMLQLFVLFFLLPELDVSLPPLAAGIIGLAVNYSAYEAEIYRAGLQAVPVGQMEAALTLGMTRGMALRRIIVPQAARIVIPPVTNDFIALFKDTSVCSVITLVELTKRYSILANSTGGVVEFAVATAFLYLVMSLPLSWLSRWSEARLDNVGATGGAS